ncbi:MAG: hypothetical protein HYS81_01205 [Candidatus Aenigmatarchaeota archaeon]|nr:MAG: hypothetical protein HYS81_01205 [Candidatus Aenigmarchaeota archaeon]
MPSQSILKPENKVLIFADNREFASKVVRELALMDCIVQPQQLAVADFILSDRVGVERKTTADFVSSVFDQRLFEQIRNLKNSYEKPILIIEGVDVYGERNVHPNSIRGALASIAIDYAVPILWTQDEAETAGMLFWIAKREQLDLGRPVAIRAEKRRTTLSEHQEFLVAGLPDVNRVRARALLEHLRTPEKLFRASEERLQKVGGIGPVLARRIREVLTSEYAPAEGSKKA